MANTIQSSSFHILIFNDENYDFWSTKMKTYFRFQDLWDIVERGFTIPSDTTVLTDAQTKEKNENEQKDVKALFVLQQAMTIAIFPRIKGATTTKEAWATLQEEFQGSDKVRAIKLQTL